MGNAREDYRKDMKFEPLVPSSWWVPGNDPYCLTLHLPGFKEGEVRLRYGNHDRIIVTGEREETNNNKVIHFEESFKVPEDSNIEEASGAFEGDVFYITIPKRAVPKEGHKISAYDQGERQKSDQNDQNLSEEEQSDAVKKILQKVMKNRSTILTGIIAFSLGVLVSFHYKKKVKGEKVAMDVPQP